MTITTNELKAIAGIANSDFNDGEPSIDHWVWSWSANTFGNKRSFSGAMSSLIQKGLAKSDGASGDDACVCLTQAGLDAYNAHKQAA